MVDFGSMVDKLTPLWSFLGSIGIGTIIGLICMLANKKTLKQVKTEIKFFQELIEKVKSIEVPNSVLLELTVIAEERFNEIKSSLNSSLRAQIDSLKRLIEAIAETLALSRTTPVDSSKALMSLINKPVEKKQVIRVERKIPKSDVEVLENSSKGGEYISEVD